MFSFVFPFLKLNLLRLKIKPHHISFEFSPKLGLIQNNSLKNLKDNLCYIFLYIAFI